MGRATRLSINPRGRFALAVGLAGSMLSSASPALAQTFSAERPLGSPGENARVIWQGYSQVVFDGENYVALWEADRSRFYPTTGFQFATRVNEDGEVLDPHGILIARSAATASTVLTPAPWGVLVVYPGGGLKVVRMDRSGTLADPEPRTLAETADSFPYPTAACLDTGCLVLYTAGDNAVKGFALDGCGDIVPGTELELPDGEWTLEADPSVGGYVAFGRMPRTSPTFDFVVVGLSAEGHERFAPRTVKLSYEPGMAFGVGSATSLAVWTESRAGTIRAACWDHDGVPVGETEVLRSDEGFWLGRMSPEGDGFRLGVQVGDTAGLLRIDGCGRPLEANLLPLAATDDVCRVTPPRPAFGARTAFATWDMSLINELCEKPRATSALLVPGDPPRDVFVQGAGARMGPPSLGSDGSSYLAAWHEERDGASGLYTQALDIDGNPLEEPVLTIPAAAHAAPARTSRVAFVGGRYVAELHPSTEGWSPSWDEPNVAVDIDPVTLARGEPRVQFGLGTPGANAFLEATSEISRQGEDIRTLYRLKVRATDAAQNALGDEWIRLQEYGESDEFPAVAFDGQNFGVVWTHLGSESSSSTQRSLHFMSFDEHGQPLLPSPVDNPGIGTFDPASLTFGAGVYLLGLRLLDQTFAVVRLSTEGELLDSEPKVLLPAGPGAVQRPLIGAVFDGEAFVFAFSERSLSSLEPAARHVDFDVRIARVAPDGTPLSDGWLATSREEEIGSAGLATIGDGQSLVGYHRFDDDPSALAQRAFVRTIGSGACAVERPCDDAECDGVCCVRGCSREPVTLACDVADCETSCADGTHCVPGLGCVADAERKGPRVIRTEGCGCTIPGNGSGSAWASALLLLVSVLRLSARRTRELALRRR